jgi:transposase
MWAGAALDTVRHGMAAELRVGDAEAASALKGSMWALRKNPENLTGPQRTTLAAIQATNKPLYRAYLLQEQHRAVFDARSTRRHALLAGWPAWARRSRIPAFVKLAKTITKSGR